MSTADTTTDTFATLDTRETAAALYGVEELGREHGTEARAQGFEGTAEDIGATEWDAVNAYLLDVWNCERLDGYSAEARPVVAAYLRGFNAAVSE